MSKMLSSNKREQAGLNAIQHGASVPRSQGLYAFEGLYGDTLTAYAKTMVTTYIIGPKTP